MACIRRHVARVWMAVSAATLANCVEIDSPFDKVAGPSAAAPVIGRDRLVRPRSQPPQRRVGGALARGPGPADRAPQGFMGGFTGEKNAVAHRFGERRPRSLAARRSRREGAENPGFAGPPGGGGRFTAFFTSGPNRPVSQSSANATMAGSPMAASSRPKPPPTSTMQSAVPAILARSAAVRAELDFRKPFRRSAGRADFPAVRARCGRSSRAEAWRWHRAAFRQVGNESDSRSSAHRSKPSR